MNIEIDKKNVLLAEPIKTLGEVTVPVKIGYQMTSEITVQIVPLEAEL
jgi:large subunit ribosomal protein L9